MQSVIFQNHLAYNINKVKVKVDLTNYATKSDFKSATGVYTLNTLDNNKLKTVPADLSKLNNVAKNDVIKNSVYDELVKKVNAIQTINTNDFV